MKASYAFAVLAVVLCLLTPMAASDGAASSIEIYDIAYDEESQAVSFSMDATFDTVYVQVIGDGWRTEASAVAVTDGKCMGAVVLEKPLGSGTYYVSVVNGSTYDVQQFIVPEYVDVRAVSFDSDAGTLSWSGASSADTVMIQVLGGGDAVIGQAYSVVSGNLFSGTLSMVLEEGSYTLAAYISNDPSVRGVRAFEYAEAAIAVQNPNVLLYVGDTATVDVTLENCVASEVGIASQNRGVAAAAFDFSGDLVISGLSVGTTSITFLK